jgi:DNA-binding protein HU-beta
MSEAVAAIALAVVRTHLSAATQYQRNSSRGPPMQKSTAKPETITIRHLAATLADSHGLPKSKMNDMLAVMVDTITGHLKKGRRIRFSGLGILQVRKRAARMGRNPATGEKIKIKAKKRIAFRPAKELKEAV